MIYTALPRNTGEKYRRDCLEYYRGLITMMPWCEASLGRMVGALLFRLNQPPFLVIVFKIHMAPALGNIPSSPSPGLKVALAWMDHLTSKDYEAISSIMSADYKHTILPNSIGLGATRSKEEILKFWEELSAPLEGFQFIVHEIIENPTKIAVHASSTAGSPKGTYTNEYVFMFYTTEKADGTWKLDAIQEFLDSKYTSDYFGDAIQDA
ncbi:hypothetical protein ABKN59_011250 [Abortiporus biennis]